jgi:aldose 1-epimerase
MCNDFLVCITKEPLAGNTDVVCLKYKGAGEGENTIEAAISPFFGSNLFKIKFNDKDLIYTDYKVFNNRGFTGIYVLFPFPNRVKDKKYTFNNKSYSLEAVDRFGIKHLVHGLVFDRPWGYEQPVASKDHASVKTYIDIDRSHPCYESFPFKCRLSLNYILKQDGILLEYEVINHSRVEMPFGFGLHPHFVKLSGKDKTKITVPAKYVMDTDSELIPSGKLVETEGTMHDLNNQRIVDKLELDHVFTGLKKNKPATIEYVKERIKIIAKASDDFTHAVLYTPKDAPFFCLENQTCSTDAINLHEKGFITESNLLVLKPGKTHKGFVEYLIQKTC